MATPLAGNLKWAQKAVGFVRRQVKTTANIPRDTHDYNATHADVVTYFAGRAAILTGLVAVRAEAGRRFEHSLKRLTHPDDPDPADPRDFSEVQADVGPRGVQQLEQRATAGAAAGSTIGNCDEMANLAYQFLKDAGEVGPLELVAFTSPDPAYDHIWVMIGRAVHADGFRERDPATWGPEAVWCDPWQRTASLLGRVYSVADWIAGQVQPPPDPQFRLDTVAIVAAGLPDSLNICLGDR